VIFYSTRWRIFIPNTRQQRVSIVVHTDTVNKHKETLQKSATYKQWESEYIELVYWAAYNMYITYVWEEHDEFLHVEANTLQSGEVRFVQPLNSVSTDDVTRRNSDDNVSHAAYWSNIGAGPPVSAW